MWKGAALGTVGLGAGGRPSGVVRVSGQGGVDGHRGLGGLRHALSVLWASFIWMPPGQSMTSALATKYL